MLQHFNELKSGRWCGAAESPALSPPWSKWLVCGSIIIGSSSRTTVATDLNAVPLK